MIYICTFYTQHKDVFFFHIASLVAICTVQCNIFRAYICLSKIQKDCSLFLWFVLFFMIMWLIFWYFYCSKIIQKTGENQFEVFFQCLLCDWMLTFVFLLFSLKMSSLLSTRIVTWFIIFIMHYCFISFALAVFTFTWYTVNSITWAPFDCFKFG